MKLQLPILLIILGLTSISGQAENDTNSIENEINSRELDISNRIFGGSTVGRNEYKYVARLHVTFTTRTAKVCSGVVLTPKIIITVAHCVERPGGEVAKLVRAYLPRGGWYFFNSQEITVNHHEQDLTREASVAILRKNTAGATFMRNFEPAPKLLPETQDLIVTPGPGRIAGWGRTSNSPLYTSRLQSGNVNILETSVCQNFYNERAPGMGPNGLMCTDNAAAGTCAGDWGGPLLVDSNGQNVLRGLSLFRRGTNCDNSEGAPSAYFNLASVGDWLKKTFPELATAFVP